MDLSWSPRRHVANYIDSDIAATTTDVTKDTGICYCAIRVYDKGYNNHTLNPFFASLLRIDNVCAKIHVEGAVAAGELGCLFGDDEDLVVVGGFERLSFTGGGGLLRDGVAILFRTMAGCFLQEPGLLPVGSGVAVDVDIALEVTIVGVGMAVGGVGEEGEEVGGDGPEAGDGCGKKGFPGHVDNVAEAVGGEEIAITVADVACVAVAEGDDGVETAVDDAPQGIALGGEEGADGVEAFEILVDLDFTETGDELALESVEVGFVVGLHEERVIVQHAESAVTERDDDTASLVDGAVGGIVGPDVNENQILQHAKRLEARFFLIPKRVSVVVDKEIAAVLRNAGVTVVEANDLDAALDLVVLARDDDTAGGVDEAVTVADHHGREAFVEGIDVLERAVKEVALHVGDEGAVVDVGGVAEDEMAVGRVDQEIAVVDAGDNKIAIGVDGAELAVKRHEGVTAAEEVLDSAGAVVAGIVNHRQNPLAIAVEETLQGVILDEQQGRVVEAVDVVLAWEDFATGEVDDAVAVVGIGDNDDIAFGEIAYFTVLALQLGEPGDAFFALTLGELGFLRRSDNRDD